LKLSECDKYGKVCTVEDPASSPQPNHADAISRNFATKLISTGLSISECRKHVEHIAQEYGENWGHTTRQKGEQRSND